MDRISGLSDDVLVKILSYLPTKVAVSTSVLSKRWDFLWMCLPKLEYVTRSRSESEKLHCFIKRTLPLHRAPVIESFRLDCMHTKPEDVELWVVVAVSRQLRELDIRYEAYTADEVLLSSSLFACKSLEILKLCGDIALDVPRMDMVSLPSLKILQLENMTGVNGESLRRLLTICPLLEKLLVDFCGYIGNLSVISPSLLSLSLYFEDNPEELEIDTPSLKYLNLNIYDTDNFSIRNMPKLEEANLDVKFSDIDCLFGSITSVKRLKLCCSKAVYSDSFVFNQLEHLKLCNRRLDSGNVIAWWLKFSPNVRVLDIFQMAGHGNNSEVYWKQPSTVPEYFVSSLESFSWSKYMGRPQDRDVVVYILENACRLKTATISSSERSITKKFQMMKELSSSSRASTTCRLLFD